MGRKLYNPCRRQPLTDLQVHVEPYHLYVGAIPPAARQNWQQKLETIAPRCEAAFGGRASYTRWAERFLLDVQ